MLIALCGFSIIYFSDKESYEYVWPNFRYFLLYAFEEHPLPDTTLITSNKTTIETTNIDSKTKPTLSKAELEKAVTDKINENIK